MRMEHGAWERLLNDNALFSSCGFESCIEKRREQGNVAGLVDRNRDDRKKTSLFFV